MSDPSPPETVSATAPAVIPLPPRLPPAVPRSGLSEPGRLALRQLLEDHARALALAFAAGADPRLLVRARAELVGRVVAQVWLLHLGEPAGVALYAQGGFGRGRLFPYSDIDLLVLDNATTAATSRGLERVFAVLWDIGLKPSHAVRTPAAQQDLAAHDLSVFTAMLEARWLAGDDALATLPAQIAQTPGLWPLAQFIAGRRAEHAQRRARRGDDEFRLEPDLKDGPGGLRHVDMLYWLGLRLGLPADLRALQQGGLLDATVLAELADAEALLLRYRYALHLLAGRAEERLLFDHQRTLALQMGHRDDAAALGVERFMQAYYRASASVATLVDEALARIEAGLHAPEPVQPLDDHWQRRGAWLEARDAAQLATHPAWLFEGAGWLDAAQGIHGFGPETARAARSALRALPSGALADDAAALQGFDALLQRGAAAPAVLTALARCGALGALIPAFAQVSGRMQYDLFHLYTVDEHTLRVLAQLAAFAQPAAQATHALAHALWGQLADAPVLLLAALFHDIAKGRGGDHSALGEVEVRAFAQHLGWPPARVEIAAFLVREHLLLSQTAQRQDIGDPAVVARFAARVGEQTRLELLYLLTVADIIGTSPALWNGFKDRLLADLYHATRRLLRGDAADAAARAADSRARALELLSAQGYDAAAVQACWRRFPADAFVRQRATQLAWQTAMLLDDAVLPRVAVRTGEGGGALELFLLAADRDGLFADVTALLEREGWSVQEARIRSDAEGRAFDVFTLLDGAATAGTPAQAERLCVRLRAVLAAQQTPPRALRTLPRRLRHFQRAPRIRFEQTAASLRTRLGLRSSDRPGLLADIAAVFRTCGVRVHDARIATFGERAEDYFELSDRHDRALDAGQCAALEAALLRRLAPTPADEDTADA